ncbi:hypothetical protein Esti_004844 [Eimeria stiedai]
MNPPHSYVMYRQGEQLYYSPSASYHPFQQQQLYVHYAPQQQRQRKCVLRLAAEACGWLLSAALCVVCSALGGAVSCCKAAALEAETFIEQQQQQHLQQQRLQQQRLQQQHLQQQHLQQQQQYLTLLPHLKHQQLQQQQQELQQQQLLMQFESCDGEPTAGCRQSFGF